VSSGQIESFGKVGTHEADGVRAIEIDRTGTVWIGSAHGLAARKGSSFASSMIDENVVNAEIAAILTAPDGSVWVGSSSGLWVYNKGSWKKYTTAQGLPSDNIQALCAGSGGSIWVGTNRGIGVYNKASWKVWDMKNGLSWNDTKALAYDARKSEMWAAVGEQDVNLFHGSEWKTYMGIQQGITSIMVDTQSRVWFGSKTGLLKFNGDEWVSDQSKLGVPVVMVSEMLCDSQGDLWFGSEHGIVHLNNPYPF
jgi:ligand-binding sensor domain-containing protein